MTNKDPDINLTLPVSRVNQVLQALAQRPFAEVHELMADVSRQAQDQLRTIEMAAASPPKAQAAEPEPHFKGG